MPLSRFKIPPGLNKQSTQYGAGMSWYDANNVRWNTPYAETIGGWRVDPGNSSTFYGIARAIFSWKDFSESSYRFLGTNNKFYLSSGNQKYDITPIRSTASGVVDPFKQVKAGNHIVTINHASHGASTGDFVVFTSVASDIGGLLTLLTTTAITNATEGFQIVQVLDDDYYMIAMFDKDYAKLYSDIDVASGGGSCNLTYKINSGINYTVAGGIGWGAGLFGDGEPLGLGGSGNNLTEVAVDTSFGGLSGAAQKVRFTIDKTSFVEPVVGDLIYISGVTSSSAGTGVFTSTTVGTPALQLKELSNQWFTITDVVWASSYVYATRHDGATTTANGTTSGFVDIDGNNTNVGLADTQGDVDVTQRDLNRNWGQSSEASLFDAKTRQVYVDNFGEDLLVSNGYGPIFYYDTSANTTGGIPITGNSCVNIVDVPGQLEAVKTCTKFLMSEKFGHCIALGANDIGASLPNSMLVRWSDAFNPFDWFPTSSNEAGGQTLDQGSSIITGISAREENLIFTNSAMYSMKYVGYPITYGFQLISAKVSIASENSIAVVDDNVFFLAKDAFYVYNGRISILSDNVHNYVFDDINEDELTKAFCSTNYKFSEVNFFYPSSLSTECDRCVTYNYANGTWSINNYDMASIKAEGSGSSTSPGTTYNRTTWEDARVFSKPVAGVVERLNNNITESTGGATGNGQPATVTVPTARSMIFSHEDQTSAQGGDMVAYVETGDMDLLDGQKYAFYSRIIPDMELFNEDCDDDCVITIGVVGRDLPGKSQKAAKSVNVTFTADDTSVYTPNFNQTAIRGRARSASIKVSSSAAKFGWRLGELRVDLRPDGGKS